MTAREWVDQFADDTGTPLLLADGFEEAVLGIAFQFTRAFVVYDRTQCLEILRTKGMSEEEADEYFAFNVQGAYVGEATPAFLMRRP